MKDGEGSDADLTFEQIENELRAEGLLPEPEERACRGCGRKGLNHEHYEGENVKGWFCDDCWQEADSAEYAISDGRMTQEERTASVQRKKSNRLLRN